MRKITFAELNFRTFVTSEKSNLRIFGLHIVLFFVVGTLFSQPTKIEEKFITCAANGDSAKVQKFIEKGIHVDVRNKSRWSALAYACKYGHLGTVQVLVMHKADVNLPVNTGSTPLLVALNNNNYEIAEYLIENGADINKKDLTGMSPLAWVAKRGDLKMVKYLVDKGAEVNSKNVSSRTVLDNAGTEKVKAFLRNHGAKTSKELM